MVPKNIGSVEKKTTFPLSWIWKGNKKEKHTQTPREQWGKEIRVKSIKKWTLTGYMRQPKSNQWRKIQGTIEHKIIQIASIWDKKDRSCFSFPDSPSCFSIVYFVLLTNVFILGKKYFLPHSIRVVHNSHPHLGSQPFSPFMFGKWANTPTPILHLNPTESKRLQIQSKKTMQFSTFSLLCGVWVWLIISLKASHWI